MPRKPRKKYTRKDTTTSPAFRPFDPAAGRAWMADASCAQMDPDVFWDYSEVAPATYQHLIRICDSCPVKAQCRAYVDAMEAGRSTWGIYGIWAGEAPQDRIRRRKREAYHAAKRTKKEKEKA